MTIDRGANPARIKVVGNVAGQPPYRGLLRHRGLGSHPRRTATRPVGRPLDPRAGRSRSAIAGPLERAFRRRHRPRHHQHARSPASTPPTGGDRPDRARCRVPQLVAPGDGRAARRCCRRSCTSPRRRWTSPAGALALPWDAGAATTSSASSRAQPRRRGAGAAGRLGEVVAVPRRRRPHGADPAVGRAGRGAARCRRSRRRRAYLRAPRGGVERTSHARRAARSRAGVLLTVPASFDAAARELTCEAAARRRARARDAARGAAGGVLRVARRAWATAGARSSTSATWCWSCDVGGGTTDFTLIAVRRERRRPRARARRRRRSHPARRRQHGPRARARCVQQRLEAAGTKLDAWQLHALAHACRGAKETLLGDAAPTERPGHACSAAAARSSAARSRPS